MQFLKPRAYCCQRRGAELFLILNGTNSLTSWRGYEIHSKKAEKKTKLISFGSQLMVLLMNDDVGHIANPCMFRVFPDLTRLITEVFGNSANMLEQVGH